MANKVPCFCTRGSGPTQLALALLLELSMEDMALLWFQGVE
jgi:hypothetical protein